MTRMGRRINIEAMEIEISRLSKDQIIREIRMSLICGFVLKRMKVLQRQLRMYN